MFRASPVLILSLLLILLPSRGSTSPARPAWADAVDAAIEDVAIEGGPGGVVGVVVGHRLAYSRAFGLADVDSARANTVATRFGIASCTKQFTAACILLLADRGLLDLEADIRTILPDLALETAIPVGRLLTHSSGLQDYSELMILARGRDHLDDFSRDDVLAMIRRQRSLSFEPGTDENYSNTNFVLLGEIVERVSGVPLADFARREFLDPLGMTTAGFGPVSGHATAAEYAARPTPEDPFPLAVGTSLGLYGAGGLYASVEDLALWMANLADSGSSSLGERLAQRDSLPDGRLTTHGRGVLSGRNASGHRWVEHTGRGYGGTSILTWWPDLEVSTIVLTNSDEISARAISNAFYRDILDTLPAPDVPAEDPDASSPDAASDAESAASPPDPPAPLDLMEIPRTTLAGLYPADGTVGQRTPPSGGVGVDRLELSRGALTYVHHQGSRFDLERFDTNVFDLLGLGRPLRLYFSRPSGEPPHYRVWDPQVTGDDLSDPVSRLADLTAEEAQRFVGTFRSPDLVHDVPVEIVREGTRLFFTWGVERRRAEVFHVGDARLSTWKKGPHGMQCNLVFPREGPADSFTYEGHRVWHLRFDRTVE